MLDNLYTTGDMAYLMGVSINTIKNWVKKGFIKPSRITPTKRLLFSQETLDKLKEDMNNECE